MNTNVKSMVFRFSNELRAAGFSQFGAQYTEEHFKHSGTLFDGLNLEEKRLFELAMQLFAFLVPQKVKDFDLRVRTKENGTFYLSWEPYNDSKA